MVIQLNDYNEVVNGLRAQLELQRALTREKAGIIAGQARTIFGLQEEVALVASREIASCCALRAKLDYCERLAIEPQLATTEPPPFGNDCGLATLTVHNLAKRYSELAKQNQRKRRK